LRRAVERAVGAAFERQQELFGGFEALRRVFGDRLEQDVFKPARESGR
jgi:hypothetical protein